MKSFDEIMRDIRKRYPYDAVPYSIYNGGWQGACDCVQEKIGELIEQQQKEIESLQVTLTDKLEQKQVIHMPNGKCSYRGCNLCDKNKAIISELNEQIEQLKAKRARWIPFILEYDEDEKRNMFQNAIPDDEQIVLVTNGKLAWEDTFMNDGNECWLDGSGASLGDDVIAWQLLPEPYKGEEE